MVTKAVTRERAHYCSHCGGAVKPEAEACPTCGRGLDGVLEGLRCQACGHVAGASATACPQCHQPLGVPVPAPAEDLADLIQRTVEDLNGLMADRRAWLDRLEKRLERTRTRLGEIRDSPRDLDAKERARLTVWLKDAEAQRGDALRMAGVLVGVGEAFSVLQGRLHETLMAPPVPPAQAAEAPGDAQAPPAATPEERKKQLEAWWEAQRSVQKDLFAIAKEVGEGSPPTTQGLDRVVEELRRILEELPPGLRKRLQKAGKLEEMEKLLGPQPQA